VKKRKEKKDPGPINIRDHHFRLPQSSLKCRILRVFIFTSQ